MIVLFSIGVLAVFFAYLGSRKYLKYGLGLSFFVLWVVYAIRYNYGNDFWNYSYHFDEISNYKSISQCFNDYEPIWNVLMWLFKYGNFSVFCAFIGLLCNVIIYRFVKNNVPRKWWGLAVFIYVFSPNLYVLSFSMMRQSLAMALFLFSWNYIKQKKIVVSFLILLAAISIHTSSILTLPFIFIGYAKKIKTTGWVLFLVLLFIFFVFISQNM